MNSSHRNKVLLAEIKKTLDEQEEMISFSAQSRLTQARFHAVDRGILNNSFNSYSQTFLLKKVAVASAFFVVVASLLSTTGTFSLLQDEMPTSASSRKQSIKTVESSEDNEDTDTKEEVDVYHWLYEHYG